MDIPQLTPEHKQSELQKFKIYYEHVADGRPPRRTKPTNRK